MKIDLHIHTRTGSDGALPMEEVFLEAKKRRIDFMSITDHDNIDFQKKAIDLAQKHDISYITGVELNVTFKYNQKSFSLDFLGYRYDCENKDLKNKLVVMRERREARAREILAKLNIEFEKEHREKFTEQDMKNIEANVDGAFGRPHIADYLVKKGIVGSRQEAFDRYLVKADVPKYPLSLEDASGLIRNAGGVLVLAHGNDPHGTSLFAITPDLNKQANIIQEYMIKYIDGLECWHTSLDAATTTKYTNFAKRHNMIMTGGSDCHQSPILMGTVNVPDWVAGQFNKKE